MSLKCLCINAGETDSPETQHTDREPHSSIEAQHTDREL